jgi:hypothetical protein
MARTMFDATISPRIRRPDDYRLNDDGPSERFRSVRAVPGEHWDLDLHYQLRMGLNHSR